MDNIKGEKFSWYLSPENNIDKVFDTIGEAVRDAKESLKGLDERYVNICVVEYLDKNEMIDQGIEGLLSSMDGYIEDFVFGIDSYNYDFSEKRYDNERIKKRLKEAIDKIVNEEYDPHIEWRSNTFNAEYDLVEDNWVLRKNEN